MEDIIKSLAGGGAIVGIVDWVRETYYRRTPSLLSSLSVDGGGNDSGDGGGDIVLLGGSSIAVPWP